MRFIPHAQYPQYLNSTLSPFGKRRFTALENRSPSVTPEASQNGVQATN